MIKKVALSVLGLVFAVAGVVLVLKSGSGVKVSASTATYTTNWSATKLLVAQRKDFNNTISYSDQIAIGVAGWNVTGSLTDGTKFKETWTIPTALPTFTRNTTGEAILTADNTGWLAGFIGVKNYNSVYMYYILSTVDVGAGIENKKGTHNARNMGITTSCLGADEGECMYASGAYGLSDEHAIDSATDGKMVGSMMAIPLKWSVSGVVCDGGETACN